MFRVLGIYNFGYHYSQNDQWLTSENHQSKPIFGIDYYNLSVATVKNGMELFSTYLVFWFLSNLSSKYKMFRVQKWPFWVQNFEFSLVSSIDKRACLFINFQHYQPAQNQPKSHFLFHENVYLRDFYIMTLIPVAKLYIPSTLNIDLILWHTQLIVCAVKC